MNSHYAIGKWYSRRIVKFLGTGVLNTLFGYGVFAGLVFINLSYLIALFIATLAGIIFNYFSFGRMVFSARGGWFVFGKFVSAYTMVYGINATFLGILTHDFHWSPYLGQILCILPSVVISWILMNYWVYKNG